MPETPTPGAAPGQSPPFGQSPAVGATPNRGFEAQGVQRLGAVIKMLEQLIPMVGAVSEIGKDVMQAITKLSKHIPAGAVTPQAERNTLEAAQIRNMQNSQLQQLQSAQQQKPPAAPPGMAA